MSNRLKCSYWYSLTLEVWFWSGLSSGTDSFRCTVLGPRTDIMIFISSGEEASSCPPSITPIWARPPRSRSLMSWASRTAYGRQERTGTQHKSIHLFIIYPAVSSPIYSITFNFSCLLLWGPFHCIIAFPKSSRNMSPRLKLLQETSTCRHTHTTCWNSPWHYWKSPVQSWQ